MEDIVPELQGLCPIADPLERRLYFAAILTKALGREGKHLIVVGGQALQFYTAGAYATADIDFVCPAADKLSEILSTWGFRRQGRHWQHDALELLVEVPGETLAGDPARITEVEIHGLSAQIIGIEDLILDGLRAAVHWRSEEDRYWASNLINANYQTLDWDYLRSQAEANSTARLLAELEAQARA